MTLLDLVLSIRWRGLPRLMAHDYAPPPPDARVETLLRKGLRAYHANDMAEAHRYWRRAAQLAPYDERVWMALYRVLTDEDDRRVCLQNILAINPFNVGARKRLRQFEEQT